MPEKGHDISPFKTVSKRSSLCEEESVQSPTIEIVKISGVGSGVGVGVGEGEGESEGEELALGAGLSTAEIFINSLKTSGIKNLRNTKASRKRHKSVRSAISENFKNLLFSF